MRHCSNESCVNTNIRDDDVVVLLMNYSVALSPLIRRSVQALMSPRHLLISGVAQSQSAFADRRNSEIEMRSDANNATRLQLHEGFSAVADFQRF